MEWLAHYGDESPQQTPLPRAPSAKAKTTQPAARSPIRTRSHKKAEAAAAAAAAAPAAPGQVARSSIVGAALPGSRGAPSAPLQEQRQAHLGAPQVPAPVRIPLGELPLPALRGELPNTCAPGRCNRPLGAGAPAAAPGATGAQQTQQPCPMQGGTSLGAQQPQARQPQPAAQHRQQQDAQAAQGNTNMSPEQKQQCIHASKVWLLFMWHCARCDQDDARCRHGQSCAVGRDLWTHMLECRLPQCDHPHCAATRKLLKHHMRCQDADCPICGPVRDHIAQHTARQDPAAHSRPMQDTQQQQTPAAPRRPMQDSQQTQQPPAASKRPVQDTQQQRPPAALPGGGAAPPVATAAQSVPAPLQHITPAGPSEPAAAATGQRPRPPSHTDGQPAITSNMLAAAPAGRAAPAGAPSSKKSQQPVPAVGSKPPSANTKPTELPTFLPALAGSAGPVGVMPPARVPRTQQQQPLRQQQGTAQAHRAIQQAFIAAGLAGTTRADTCRVGPGCPATAGAANMPGAFAQDRSHHVTHAAGTKRAAASSAASALEPKQPKQHAGAGPSTAAQPSMQAATASQQQTGQQLNEHQLLHERLHSMWGHVGEVTAAERNSRSLAHVVSFAPVRTQLTPTHGSPAPSLIEGAAALRALLEAGARAASVDIESLPSITPLHVLPIQDQDGCVSVIATIGRRPAGPAGNSMHMGKQFKRLQGALHSAGVNVCECIQPGAARHALDRWLRTNVSRIKTTPDFLGAMVCGTAVYSFSSLQDMLVMLGR